MSWIPHKGALIPGPSESELELIEPLGQGAFGVVWKAERRGGLEVFAVKFPQAGTFRDERGIAAFNNELLAATRVSHMHVVRVRHVVPTTGPHGPYLVMDFLEGGTLADVVGARRTTAEQIPLQQVQRWMSQLVAAMEAINAEVLHRDLKPDNILVSGDDLLISDFGLAKVIGAATRSRSFKGGQHMMYMAPEAWRLETNEIQLDMYALGMVLFEMATLEPAYELPSGWQFEAWRDLHLYTAPRRPRDFRGDLPIGVESTILRLLNKRAQDRFPAWKEVKSALDDAWRGVPSTALQAVTRLADALNEAGVRVQQREARAHEAARRADERRRLDDYARDQLLGVFTQALDGAAPVLAGTQLVIAGGGDMRVVVLPQGGSVNILFFRLHEEMEHGREEIRVFCAVTDTRGFGFNVVLVHAGEDDLYGRWEGWQMRNNPLSRHRRKAEPFAFADEREFRQHFRYALGVTHVYSYSRISDLGARFLDFIAESSSRQ